MLQNASLSDFRENILRVEEFFDFRAQGITVEHEHFTNDCDESVIIYVLAFICVYLHIVLHERHATC